jgi:hypothetical protein
VSDPLFIKAFRVDVLDQAGTVVKTQELLNGPTNNADALVDHSYGQNQLIRTRLKSHAGTCHVKVRHGNGIVFEADAFVGTDLAIPAANTPGQQFRVRISELPKDRWREAASIPFNPPRVVITSNGANYTVTVIPNQQDATFTAVVGTGTKPVKLPSMPFPSSLGFKQATLVITPQHGATPGAQLRLGIRGAGRGAKIKLPPAGQSVTVEPDQFKLLAPGDATKLGPQVTLAKYQEKQGEGTTVQYTK